MADYLKEGADNHTGGSGSCKNDGTIHFTNYDRNSNYRTSYDEDRKGNVSNVHSTDQNTNKHTQHDVKKDGDPRKY